MQFGVFFLLVLSTLALCNATLQGIVETNRLLTILQGSLKSKDISSLYYAVRGLKQFNVAVPDICEHLKTVKYDLKNIEQVFQLANTAALTNCQNSLKPDILTTPTQLLDKKDATIPEIYHAVYTLKALGKGTVYDKEDALKNLIQLLKKDDTPANYGYVFTLCEHMGCQAWTATHAEGVILSADETDSKALHFEGGLPVTSLILSTLFRSYKTQNKPVPITEDQRYKFAEYLLSRRSVNSAKGAALLLEAATALADYEPTPISITIKGKKYITSESFNVEIAITDLIGRAVKTLKPDDVVAQSGTRLSDDVVVLSKQPLTQKPSEPTTFVLNLSKIKAQYGMYKIALSAGSKTTNVNVAVLGEIQVSNVEVGIGDVDGTTSPKITTVTYPNKLSEKLVADHLQKVSLKFTIRDKWNKPMLVQQAFVRIANVESDEETIFVAEPDSAKAYKVELRVGSLRAGQGFSSGEHSVSLLVGDGAAAAPVYWDLGHLTLNFGNEVAPSAPASPVRGAQVEISHLFRAAEARPSRLVSDVFSLLSLAPLLLLLLLWAKLGINFGNLSFSALLFHLALGASFGLYGLLWLQLSMFEALRLALPLGALTFLSGHRALRQRALAK